jgi:glutamate 5-kinase
VINENDVVATDELVGQVYGDNDRLSAMVANVVRADLLVLLGEMEGLFTADPHLDPEALVIPQVAEITPEIERAAGGPLDGRGRGGMASKLAAARLATASGTEVVIASGRTRQAITRICAGEALGTRFLARHTELGGRKRRILSAVMDLKAGVTVNEGAAKALTEAGASLLPVGVLSVQGQFERGDRIGVHGPDGRLLFTGVANYGAGDVSAIMGSPSREIKRLLGHDYGPEVVHRDNLAPV